MLVSPKPSLAGEKAWFELPHYAYMQNMAMEAFEAKDHTKELIAIFNTLYYFSYYTYFEPPRLPHFCLDKGISAILTFHKSSERS